MAYKCQLESREAIWARPTSGQLDMIFLGEKAEVANLRATNVGACKWLPWHNNMQVGSSRKDRTRHNSCSGSSRRGWPWHNSRSCQSRRVNLCGIVGG